MKCEEFKESLQNLLDARGELDWPNELSVHATSCAQCRAFADSLIALHQAMQQLPRVSPSAELMGSLKKISQSDAPLVKIGWGPEIRLGAQLLLPLALPYIAQAFSLTTIQYLLEALILLLGLTVFGIAALKPLFLGSPAYRLAPDRH
jgi:hypothetical protein